MQVIIKEKDEGTSQNSVLLYDIVSLVMCREFYTLSFYTNHTSCMRHIQKSFGTARIKNGTDTSFTLFFFCHEIMFWYGCQAQVFGKVGKSWFGSANRLHYKFFPSRVSISGTRTNFIRARTTFSVGPSTGEIWVRHG